MAGLASSFHPEALGSDPRDSIRLFEKKGYDACTAELMALAIMEVR